MQSSLHFQNCVHCIARCEINVFCQVCRAWDMLTSWLWPLTSQLSEHLFISHSSICVWVLHAAYSLRQNTQLHCHDRFTGCASRSESSSGCVFWRTIVCMTQQRRTCLTTCGRHQRSSLVAVSALLTPRHCRCRRLVGLPLATVPLQWLQRGHGTVCHQGLGPAPRFWHSEGRPSLTFFVWLDAVYSDHLMVRLSSFGFHLDVG